VVIFFRQLPFSLCAAKQKENKKSGGLKPLFLFAQQSKKRTKRAAVLNPFFSLRSKAKREPTVL
jgi:hypothetical protein